LPTLRFAHFIQPTHKVYHRNRANNRRTSTQQYARKLDYGTLQHLSEKSPTAIPGYRPLTHAAFIKSLTPDARKKLALEIERYVATYGILDGL
jgi:hypothetical protein